MGGQDLFVFGDEYELADTTAPVITVLGNNPETVEFGQQPVMLVQLLMVEKV